jgi:hypothetical protein
MIGADQPLPGGFVENENAHITAEQNNPLSSKQESKLIHYIDQRLLDISRLYKRRAVEDSDQAVASQALDQLLEELCSLIQILTQVPLRSASIVIAYALNILDIVTDYIRVFNKSPDKTFTSLRALVSHFVRLLDHHVLSITEQTRLQGLAARLRNVVYTKYEGLEPYEAACSEVFAGSIMASTI